MHLRSIALLQASARTRGVKKTLRSDRVHDRKSGAGNQARKSD